MLRATTLVLTGVLLVGAPVAWAVGNSASQPHGAARPSEARVPRSQESRSQTSRSPAAPAPGDTPLGMLSAAAPSGGAQPDGANQPSGRAPRWAWPLTPRPSVARPFDGPPQPWLAGHRGADLAAAAGAEVRAPADGVVAFRGTVAGRQVLSIDHANGLRSTYEPVTSALAAGTAVTRGQILGLLEPGHVCPAPTCLHWGARRGETYVDPVTLVGAGPPILLPLR